MSTAPPSSSWPPPGLSEGSSAAAVSSPERPPWPPWSAAVAFFTALALAIVGGLVVALVGAAFGASLQHPPPAVNLAATVVQDFSFVGAVLYLAARFGPLVAAQFGLRRTPLWPALRWMGLAAIVYIVLSVVWAALVNLKQRDQLPQDLGAHSGTAGLVAVCVLVTVIAPIAEELFFRGYFFAALRNWRGPLPAALVTGVVFGAIHVGSAPVAFLAPLALLGFLLCVLRWQTGSLLPCLAAHAANNALAFGANEAGWTAGQTILLMLAATAVVLLATVPFLGPRDARALV
jgi:uncharacterized protein